MEIITLVVGIGVGFVTGLYVASQIEKHIDKN
jgi:uncharacterized protein YneF (UPF0154 family)